MLLDLEIALPHIHGKGPLLKAHQFVKAILEVGSSKVWEELFVWLVHAKYMSTTKRIHKVGSCILFKNLICFWHGTTNQTANMKIAFDNVNYIGWLEYICESCHPAV